jgi:hypothetical protein
MLAFYVAMGAVCLLLVGFYFAWTPVRVWYWRNEFIDAPSQERALQAAEHLVDVGPSSYSCLEGLLQDAPHSFSRQALVSAAGRSDAQWTLPLLVNVLSSDHEPPWVHWTALQAAERILDRRLRAPTNPPHMKDEMAEAVKESRSEFLAWWHREGKAKYGRGE